MYTVSFLKGSIVLDSEGACTAWTIAHCWSLGFIWDSMHWLVQADIIVLTATFAFVVFLVGRDSYAHYIFSCKPHSHVSGIVDTLRVLRHRRRAATDLNLSIRILDSIVSVIPFLA